MFNTYYKITPNKNQSLTVEMYCLCSDRTAHYNNLKQRYDRYFFFELDDVDTYEIKGNAEAWTLFYNRFTKSIDSILTTRFDLDEITKEYSSAEENAKKGNYEYYVEEDANILFDIIVDQEIAECEIDACVNMWEEMEG